MSPQEFWHWRIRPFLVLIPMLIYFVALLTYWAIQTQIQDRTLWYSKVK